MNYIDTMTAAYIEAIYFTETGDGNQPDADAELEPIDRAQAYIDCRNFYWAVTGNLGLAINANFIDWSQAGHDLWLTRNGHGVGFWDRSDATYEAPEWDGSVLKHTLTAIARAMGGHDVTFKETV